MLWSPQRGSYTLASLTLRLKDFPEPVTIGKKKKKEKLADMNSSRPCGRNESDSALCALRFVFRILGVGLGVGVLGFEGWGLGFGAPAVAMSPTRPSVRCSWGFGVRGCGWGVRVRI